MGQGTQSKKQALLMIQGEILVLALFPCSKIKCMNMIRQIRSLTLGNLFVIGQTF